jgi:hypothetical protein
MNIDPGMATQLETQFVDAYQQWVKLRKHSDRTGVVSVLADAENRLDYLIGRLVRECGHTLDSLKLLTKRDIRPNGLLVEIIDEIKTYARDEQAESAEAENAHRAEGETRGQPRREAQAGSGR